MKKGEEKRKDYSYRTEDRIGTIGSLKPVRFRGKGPYALCICREEGKKKKKSRSAFRIICMKAGDTKSLSP